MSEAAKPLAVEDVLTSIRRLLAQDDSAADLMGEPGDPGRGETQKTLENTLAALEAAMASRLAPVPRPDEPVAGPEVAEADPDTGEADAGEAAVSVGGDAPPGVVVSEDEAAADTAVQADEILAAEPVPLSVVEPSPAPIAEALPPPTGEAAPADLAEAPVAQASAPPAGADRDESPEIEEAPFIAIDMPDAPTPSFSFRHTAEVRRLQLVSPGGDEARKETPPAEEAGLPEPVAPEPEEVPAVGPVIAPPQPAAIMAEPELPVPPSVQRTEAPRTIIRRVERDAPRDEEEMPSLFDDSDDLPIDREVLRRLVGEVLREELQGALGQRMTRNVRKLVRAEIRRALLEQDQD